MIDKVYMNEETNMTSYFEHLNDSLSTFLNEASSDHELEFECQITKPHCVDKYNFLRVLEWCKTNSCAKKGWRHIRRESVTLDVMIDDQFRLTIYGKFYIQKFLRDEDSILQFPGGAFSCIKKRRVQNPRDFKEDGIRLSLKSETTIDTTSPRFQQIIASYPTSKKHYRLKKRESFEIDKDFVIDLTSVRSANFKNAFREKRKEKYEIELEYVPKNEYDESKVTSFQQIMYELLCIQRDALYLKPFTRLQDAEASYKEIADNLLRTRGGGIQDFGPKVMSLSMERYVRLKNEIEQGDEYTVTEKTDGLRMFGFVHENELWLRGSMSCHFHPTGIHCPEFNGSIVDGEYVSEFKDGTRVSHYLVFDCYVFNGEDIRNQILTTRLQNMKKIFTERESDYITVIPKEFEVTTRANFHTVSKRVLEKAQQSNYDIDGLIYTPNEKVGGDQLWDNSEGPPRDIVDARRKVNTNFAWDRLLKWKDVEYNSIDFKVSFLKDTESFQKVGNDFMVTDVKECTLSVLNTGKKSSFNFYDFQKHTLSNQRKPSTVEMFKSESPRDDNAGLVHIPRFDDKVRCKLGDRWSGDVIRDGDIVEFRYEKDAIGLFKWIPMRVRHDKDKPNAYMTAIDIWKSFFVPVTLETITTGNGVINDPTAYYDMNAKHDAVDMNIRHFHRTVKNMIFKDIVKSEPTKKLLDIGSGRGGDINRYIDLGIDEVVGIDDSLNNLHHPTGGAYARLSKKKHGAFDVSKYIFLAGDATKLFSKNETFHDIYREIVATRSIFDVKHTFDAASCFFAIHYMFRDDESLKNLLKNLDDNVKVGGMFGGCCFDGGKLDQYFRDHDTLHFNNDSGEKIVRVKKAYNTKEHTGSKISVRQFSIGMEHEEFLVDFDFLEDQLKTIGFVVEHTKSFEQLYHESDTNTLTGAEQQMSFLNRSFVFKRVSLNV